MPHIHTKPGQHDIVVSAYIFRIDGKLPKLILHKHKKLKKYLQFGGHVELNESPWQAIIHEIAEESGYGIRQLKVMQPKDGLKTLSGVAFHPYPVAINTHKFSEDHFHTDIDFAFVTCEEPVSEIGTNESRDIKQVSRAELAKLTAEDTYESVQQLGFYVFDFVLDNWLAVDTLDFK